MSRTVRERRLLVLIVVDLILGLLIHDRLEFPCRAGIGRVVQILGISETKSFSSRAVVPVMLDSARLRQKAKKYSGFRAFLSERAGACVYSWQEICTDGA